MRRHHLLHLLFTPHKDTTPIMNLLRFHLQHPLHLTIHRHSARILHHHRHRRTLVQNPQLALRTLLVGRVCEDAAVEEGAVRVSDHGADVAGAVGLAVLLGRVFQGLEVGFCLVGPVGGVAFIDGVDSSLEGDAHVRVGQDEFAESVVLYRIVISLQHFLAGTQFCLPL